MKEICIDLKKLYHINEDVQVLNLLDGYNSPLKETKRQLLNIIDFKITRFPDGQRTIKIGQFDLKKPVLLLTRIVNGEDLLLLGQVCDVLNRMMANYTVVITYLTAARSDRLFDHMQSLDLKVVVKTIDLYTREAEYVCILDAHNFSAVKRMSSNPDKYINISIYDHENHGNNVAFNTDIFAVIYGLETRGKNLIVVYPDDGASRTNVLGCDSITFEKERNLETGEIIRFKPKSYNYKVAQNIWPVRNQKIIGETQIEDHIKSCKDSEFIIVDDLCDGGSTFIKVSEWFEKNGLNPKECLSLITPHMVQEWGINRMCKTFKNVITTNSFENWQYSSAVNNNKNLIIASLY